MIRIRSPASADTTKSTRSWQESGQPWFPFAFKQTFRDCAELVVETGARHSTVTLSLVPEFARFPAYACMLHAAFQGAIALVQAEGMVHLEFKADFAERRVVSRYTW